MSLFNRTMDNNAKAAIAAYEAQLQANASDVNWFEEAKEEQEVPMIDQVYAELKANEEGAGMVYLDNVNLKKLGITERQFAGYCAALAQQGKYAPTHDKHFGQVI